MFRPLAAALVAALGVAALCEDASACFRRRHQQFCAPYATTGPYVVGAQPRTRPSISYLDPASVEPGWEGVLRIQGSGFDKDSFALIDGNVPKMTYKSDTLLEADVKKDITAKEGKKIVKVHTGGGDLSNEAYWYVRKKASQGTGGKAKKAQVLKLCADFTLFPDNHVLGPKFALAGFAFTQLGGNPPLFVNVSGGGKGLQFPKQGMKVELPASVPVVELDL